MSTKCMFRERKKKVMTREQVKEQFPDATEDQITAILDINGTDLTEAKRGQIDKKELKRLQERDKAYQALEDADLTDAEKVQKALKAAEDAEKDFTRKSNKLEVENIFVAAGLTKEEYKDLIDGIVSDDLEKSKTLASGLVNVVSNQKEAAVQKTKEELMDGTKTPGGNGGSGSGDEDELTDAEKIASSLAKSSVDSKTTDSIIANYA